MEVKIQESGVYEEVGKPGSKRFTGYILFPDSDGYFEEIDVDARDKGQAKEILVEAIKQDYQPGGKIKKIKELN